VTPDGSLLVKTVLPEDGWLYGYILSFGSYVEVLEPARLRETVRKAAQEVFRLYS